MFCEELLHGLTPDASAFWVGTAALWAFSAAVSALGPPKAGAAGWYPWLYRFLHLLAANLDRAGAIPVATGTEEEQVKPN